MASTNHRHLNCHLAFRLEDYFNAGRFQPVLVGFLEDFWMLGSNLIVVGARLVSTFLFGFILVTALTCLMMNFRRAGVPTFSVLLQGAARLPPTLASLFIRLNSLSLPRSFNDLLLCSVLVLVFFLVVSLVNIQVESLFFVIQLQ